MDAAEEYHFLWFIEKYSYIASNFVLFSPIFNAETLERTSWYIGLWPNDLSRKGRNSLYLYRGDDDAGPETLSLKIEISVITVDGSILYSQECEKTFRKEVGHGFEAFVDMDELFVRKNTDFLPRDTLGVTIRMRRGEETVHKVKKSTARILIETEKISVLHKVENFSAFKLNEKKVLQLPSRLKTGCVFSSILYINTENSDKEAIIVDVKSSDSVNILKRKQCFVLDVDGKTNKCGEVDYRFKDCDEKETEMRKSFTRDFILRNKTKFLPKDELTLLCEYTFYIGEEHSEIDQVEISTKICKDGYCNTNKKNDSNAAEAYVLPNASESVKLRNNSTKCLTSYPTALDDFKALYDDQFLTDVQLKTATKSFPAHKTVLCARSSVFRSMLSHDMKERNTDCIQVDDMEDETVHRFLLFLYSDSLEDLQWESALKLYYAADKYAMKSLKILCSSFLVDNFGPSTAGELLLLAERHSDTELREIVEEFILNHEKEVFSSKEWKKLSKTEPVLVNETMLLKYNRDERGK